MNDLKDLEKTAVISTVINFDLYHKTAPLFPEVDKYVIDGRNGMHGLESLLFIFKKMKNKPYKWLIFADEDVVFQETKYIFDWIEIMKKEDYKLAGVRDGGVISHRIYNPICCNTFFYDNRF